MKQKRNEKCDCGSGKKYKICCQIVEEEEKARKILKERDLWERIFKMGTERRNKNLTKERLFDGSI